MSFEWNLDETAVVTCKEILIVGKQNKKENI